MPIAKLHCQKCTVLGFSSKSGALGALGKEVFTSVSITGQSIPGIAYPGWASAIPDTNVEGSWPGNDLISREVGINGILRLEKEDITPNFTNLECCDL